MKSAAQVAIPPVKPLMVYDGDCRFCMAWIRRWQHATGDRVDYLPYQDPQIAARFPEIPREQCEAAVQLILADGKVYGGAEAVFRALAFNPHGGWLLDSYRHWPAFAAASEWAYRFVARHRTFFSFVTRLLWGRDPGPPSYLLVRAAFLKSLGVVYLIAFVSLWTQIDGLIGSKGILPVNTTMELVDRQFTAVKIGIDRYHRYPTLSWFNSSDAFLHVQCAAGALLAVLLIIGFAPAPCLFLLWLIYLSLTTVSGVFLAFQWDALLIETGFLAMFLAPLQWLPRRLSREVPPSLLAIWLLRLLLFRLMFRSGVVKLLSNDPTWENLTALNYHYETQPLPTWIGWHVHHLPEWFHKGETLAMFGIELIIPFLIFLPRRPRQFACLAFLALQIVIMLTGNYCFFNLLTMALCLMLLDDAALRRFWNGCRAVAAFILKRPLRRSAEPPLDPGPDDYSPIVLRKKRVVRWPLAVTLPVFLISLAFSVVQLLETYRVWMPGPRPLLAVYYWVQPLRIFNAYGLFSVMTTSRPEIVIEGSNDGVSWTEYEFKYKAGDVKRRPGFVAPHQPRLDWQMWFAALGSFRNNAWFTQFAARLLEGSPEVLSLLERNPFPEGPPRFLRAQLYEYHFNDLATRRRTGEWWRREFKGPYLPIVSKGAARPAPARPARPGGANSGR